MDMHTILDGVLLGFSIAAPVGPVSIEVVRRGSKYGWKPSLIFFLGALLALGIYLVIAVLGLSILIPEMETLLMLAGVVALCYLAYDAFEDYRGKNRVFTMEAESGQNFVPGLVLTLSNPAVLAIWTGIMGAELASKHGFGDIIWLCLGILAGACVFFIPLIALVDKCKECINKKGFKYVSLIASVLLLYFALKFTYHLLSEGGGLF
jgi:threonine/homoserine/homoserine lactone efflux protein